MLRICYFIILIIFNSCQKSDNKSESLNITSSVTNQKLSCLNIPEQFASYDEALYIIKKSDFKINEKINTSKSSWVLGASFYSCDEKFGFFIIKTLKKEYIHKNMPIRVWHEFKNAESFGQYYIHNIKGNYQLYLN